MIYFNVILQAKSDFKNILSTEMEKGTTKATLEKEHATQQVFLSPLEYEPHKILTSSLGVESIKGMYSWHLFHDGFHKLDTFI